MDNLQRNRGKGSLLIVDDDLSSRQALSELMEAEGYEVRCAPSGQTALLFAAEEPPDLVLLDIRLPDVDGFEVCRRLKEGTGDRAIPVIFLSALEDAKDKVKGFAVGGADYITKPFHAEEVLARVQTHVALYRLQGDLGRRVEEQTAELRAANALLAQTNEALNRSEEALKDRLQFETLLADLSAQFVNLPADQIDHQVGDAQRRLCEFIDVDIAALWQIVARDPLEFALTHVFRPMGGPAIPEPFTPQVYFPWALQRVLNRETVAISRHADLPPEAHRDLETWRYLGIKSTLAIPLSAGGGPVLGVLSFDMMREERAWPEPLILRLQLVAQVFANALTRKRTEEALRESEARLTLAASSADARLWEIDTKTGHVWTTEQGRKFYGLAQDEVLTLKVILDGIHPEDRERVQRAIDEALESEHAVRIDYRAVRPDGSVRWVVSRGRASVLSGGRPGCLMGVSLDITDRKQMEEQLQARLLEIEQLKQRLEQENVYLREEANLQTGHEGFVGESQAIKAILAQAEQVARTDSTVLILGETGTGKELLARAIHHLSTRKDRALVMVNCASLPPTLIEAELFGREKGAYTGAMTRMAGRFEVADGSTLFLDEVGELPLDVQAKLLRVLQDGEFERLGSTKTVRVNVRLIAATNRDLAQAIQAGTFRKDLYYRLNVFPILIPPLRERPEDIPLLAWAFVREFEKKMGKRIESIPRRVMDALRRYGWPGNARELRNVIEHAMIISKSVTLDIRLPVNVSGESPTSANIEDVERRHILNVLEKCGWRLTGQGGAAETLGLKRTTLQSRMKKLGIKRPQR